MPLDMLSMNKKLVFAFLRLLPTAAWALSFRRLDSMYGASLAGDILFLYSFSSIISIFGRAGINFLAIKKYSRYANISLFKRPFQSNYELIVLLNSFVVSIVSCLALAFFKSVSFEFLFVVFFLSVQTYYIDLLRAIRRYNESIIFGFLFSSFAFLFLLIIAGDASNPLQSSLSFLLIAFSLSCLLLRLKLLSHFKLICPRLVHNPKFLLFFYLRTLLKGYPLAISRSTSILANEAPTMVLGFAGLNTMTYLVGMSYRASFLIGFILLSAKAYIEPVLASKNIQDALQYLSSVQRKLLLLSSVPYALVLVFSSSIAAFFLPSFSSTVSTIFIIGAATTQLLNTSFGPLASFCVLHKLQNITTFANIFAFVSCIVVAVLFHSIDPYLLSFVLLLIPYALKNIIAYYLISRSVTICQPTT